MFKFEKFVGEEDFKLLKILVSNEAVMKMNMGRIFTEEEARGFFQMILSCNKSTGVIGFYKIYLIETNEFIGLGAINENNEYEAKEIEYMLLPQYWHKGYGTQVVNLLIGKIEKFFGTTSIVAITDPQNIYSRKILQNNSFVSKKIYVNEDGESAELFMKGSL